jgi:hypothetical protein
MFEAKRARVLALATCISAAFISFACFAVPMYLIRPFRHQGISELQLALWVKQSGSWLAALCAGVSLVCLALLWTRTRAWVARSVAVCAVLLAIVGATLVHVSVYELMFHPIGSPEFVSVSQVKIDSDDMVIAVRIGSDSRAYPIREMGYHHIVNDTVGGTPIVATY